MKRRLPLAVAAALLGLIVWAVVAQGATFRSVEELKLMTERELLREAYTGCAWYDLSIRAGIRGTKSAVVAAALDQALAGFAYLDRVGLVARAQAGGVAPGWVQEMRAAAGKESGEPGQVCLETFKQWLPKTRAQ